MKLSDFTMRIMRKNTTNATDIPLTISSKEGLINQNDFFNKQVASKDMSGYYLLHRGEYAYNKSYSVGYDFGSIKRLEKYDMGALSTLYICFALTKFNSDFIKHYFDSLKWYREIYMISAEGARNHGLLNVPTEDFFATLHTLPTDEAEQAKIASFLDALTARIEKQRSLVENLKKYKRGLLSTIFSKVTTFVHLKDICEYASSAKTMSQIDNTPKGAYPVYDAGGVAAFVDFYDMDTNYIAIIKDGSGVGRLQFCQAESSFIGTLGGLIPKNCSAFYLYTALQTIDFKEYVTGMAIPHIYYKDYKYAMLPYPCEKDRAKIQVIFQNLDCKITNAEMLLEKFNEMKKSLLQQLFI